MVTMSFRSVFSAILLNVCDTVTVVYIGNRLCSWDTVEDCYFSQTSNEGNL